MLLMTQNRSPENIGLSINEKILARDVLVIDNENDNRGRMSINEARRLAADLGLDLVEVSPAANPPVCRIMDYGKLLYDQKKKIKKNDKGKIETKEIRFGISIDDHDLNVKANKAKSFIDKGWKVKIQIKFKGRENAHPEIGLSLIDKIAEVVGKETIKYDQPIKDGRFINTVFMPK